MKPTSKWHPWFMLGPSLALLFLFFVFPVMVAFALSLFSWDLLTPPQFSGLSNYRVLLEDGTLFAIAKRTVGFSLIVVTGAMTLGLSLALLLNRAGRFFAFVRASIFSAYVVSWVAVALLWVWLLDPDSGLVANLTTRIGLPRIGFLTDPAFVLWTLGAVTIWKITGYAMILFIAGLQSIPPALLDAAALDGAGAWSRFRHVTWPLLQPTAAFVGTTSLIISFQAFDVVRIMTQGGPANASTLFVYAIYEQIFLDLSVGRASALTVAFFVVLLLGAGLQLKAWQAKAETFA